MEDIGDVLDMQSLSLEAPTTLSAPEPTANTFSEPEPLAAPEEVKSSSSPDFDVTFDITEPLIVNEQEEAPSVGFFEMPSVPTMPPMNSFNFSNGSNGRPPAYNQHFYLNKPSRPQPS